MARNDPIYARVDISLLFDPKLRRLTVSQKWFYTTCYLTSVEARSELLPPHYDLAAIIDRAGGDTRTGKNALQKCIEVGLLELTPEELIRVIGTRENHIKLNWNEYSPPSPYREDMGTKKRDDRKEKIGDEKRTPPPNGAENEVTMPDINKLSKALAADRAPTDAPPPSTPKQALIQKHLEGYTNGPVFKDDLSAVVKSFLGNDGRGHPIIEQAYKHHNAGEIIRDSASYAGAWRETNPEHAATAPAIFINKLKGHLGLETPPSDAGDISSG